MTATLTKVTGPSSTEPQSGGAAQPARRVSADLERSLTEAARAMLRLGVPQSALPEGVSIDRAGYWLLVRASERAPVRLSDLAECVELDLSTVSRQMRDLVASGLMVKVPDPHDGRASLLSLSDRGRAVLEAVSEARRDLLAEAMDDWTDEERGALAGGLSRLSAGLQHTRDATEETR